MGHTRLATGLAAGALAWLAAAGAAQAGEPLFGQLYTTDLLPKGKLELEQWATYRFQKAQGEFSLFQGRTALEYGLTDSVQVGLYANYDQTHAWRDDVQGQTAAPETFAEFPADPARPYDRSKFEGVSGEAIWRLLSPYKDPVGLAVYVEPEVGPNLRSLESRLILQKNFMDDRLVFAGNLTVEQEWRRLPADPEAELGSEDATRHGDHETDVNWGVGVSYRFAPKWFAGLEFQNEREWAGFNPFDSSRRTNDAYYIGPTLHYGGQRVFVTGAFLAQLPFARDFADVGVVKDNFSYADDFERYRLRVKFGYTF